MLTYKLYKGESYSKAIDNDTYLCIAASHHCLPSRRNEKYGCSKTDPSKCIKNQEHEYDYCQTFNKPCPLLETCNDKDEHCDKRKKLICETKLCIYDHVTNKTEPNPVFSDFYAFRERLIKEGILVVKEEDRYSFWSKVCFQNYIQTITTNSDNDQNVIEEKHLELRGVKVVKGRTVPYDITVLYDINVKAFNNNCTDIKPDVIVVLHYKDIKNRIEKILQEKINNKTFKPILQLSEENRYYVFAHTESNLYKRFNHSLLSDYKEFNPKGFSELIKATAITYHILNKEGELESEDRRIEIFYKIIQEYNWSLNINSLHANFRRIKDYMPKREEHRQAETLKCYEQLEEYLNKKKE